MRLYWSNQYSVLSLEHNAGDRIYSSIHERNLSLEKAIDKPVEGILLGEIAMLYGMEGGARIFQVITTALTNIMHTFPVKMVMRDV